MRKPYAALCLSFLFFAATIAQAQTHKTTLTNTDVVKLIKAGIPTNTILLILQHDKTNFNTSPDALIVLRKDGVNKTIIDAMLTNNSKAIPSTMSSQHLSNTFVTASLKALRAIEGSLDTPSFTDGQLSVPRATQDSIDNADAEARTDGERTLIVLFNRLFLHKLVNNANRQVIVLKGYEPQSEAEARKEADANPIIMKMDARQSACTNALDVILRSQTFMTTPEECSSTSLQSFSVVDNTK